MVEDEDPVSLKTMLRNTLTYTELHAFITGLILFYLFLIGEWIPVIILLIMGMFKYEGEVHYFAGGMLTAYLVYIIQ